MVVRLKQLAQEGATTGQAVVWNAVNSKWQPGDVSPFSTATITKPVFFMDNITAVTPPTPDTLVGSTGVSTLDFPDASTTGQKFEFDTPDDYASGDLDIYAVWAPQASVAGPTVVRIETSGEVADVSDNDVDTISTANTDITVPNLSQAPDRTLLRTLASGSFGAGDHILVNVKRLGGDAADTYTGDWQLVGIQYEYTTDVANRFYVQTADIFDDTDETPPSNGTLGSSAIATLDFAVNEEQKTKFIVPETWDGTSGLYLRFIYAMTTSESSKTVRIATEGEIVNVTDGAVDTIPVQNFDLAVIASADLPVRVGVFRIIPAETLHKGDEVVIKFARRTSPASEPTGDFQLVSLTAELGTSFTATADEGAVPLYVMRGSGLIGVATKVDAIGAVQSFTIRGIKVYRGTAGSGGTTIVDVNVDGTTLFSTQANRPSFAYTDGDDRLITKLPDITSVSSGALFTFDVDQVEDGSPADIVVEVYGEIATGLPAGTGYAKKDSQEIGEWLPASSNNVTIDQEGLYDLTDKVLYKRCVGQAASQQGGFATGFLVPTGITAIGSIEFEYKASTANIQIDFDIVYGGSSLDTDQIASGSASTSLTTYTWSSPTGTIAAGNMVYILMQCSVDSAETVYLAGIKINWTTAVTIDNYAAKDSHEIGEWLPASGNNVNIDSGGLYDLTDKVMYKRCVGQVASQQGGFATAFVVPVGVTTLASCAVELKGDATTTVQVVVVDTDGTEQSDSGFTPSGSKQTRTYNSPGGAYDEGQTAYVLVKCSVDSAETVSLSKITMNWS